MGVRVKERKELVERAFRPRDVRRAMLKCSSILGWSI